MFSKWLKDITDIVFSVSFLRGEIVFPFVNIMSLLLPQTIYGLLIYFFHCARVLHPGISQAAAFSNPPRADPLQNASKAEETPGKLKHICMADASSQQKAQGADGLFRRAAVSVFDWFNLRKATCSDFFCKCPRVRAIWKVRFITENQLWGVISQRDHFSLILAPQDKEQMTTGIYTTKWFLQCFIDRVSIWIS